MTSIATWNVNSLKVRLPHVLQWVAEAKPDVLAIQETKTQDVNFPIDEIVAAGYQVIFSGQKTYNGMAILSKSQATNVLTDIPGLDDPQRRILIASIDNIRIINLYVPNGENVESEKYQYKLNWLDQVNAFIKSQLNDFEHVVVLGDFNIAPEDRDVHDPKAWENKVLCSELERQAFQAMLALGLEDSFRLFDQPDRSFTWWDYRMMAFRRKMGLRIDHILASKSLAKQCVSCEIDIEPRKWERPSDHTPVVAKFEL